MGNIRTKNIKRAAFQIRDAHYNRLSTDFEKNKKAVKEMNIIPHKRTRNKVVGYLTRVMKRSK